MRPLKRTLVLVVALALLLVAPTARAAARQDLVVGGTAVVSGTEGSGLRARSGPGLTHRVLTVLPEGTNVQLLGGPVSDGQDDWYQVTTGTGVVGWSLDRYLSPSEPSPSQAGGGPLLAAASLPGPSPVGGAVGGRTFLAKMTAYANGVGGVPLNARTATGTPTRTGVVAVDPRFIPLGSLMRIQGFDGQFVAEDIGPAIRGPMLDVWLADAAAAREFGVQHRWVTVTREGSGR